MVTDNGFNVISSEELHSMFDREDLNYLEHVYGINGEWIIARDKYLTARVARLEADLYEAEKKGGITDLSYQAWRLNRGRDDDG